MSLSSYLAEKYLTADTQPLKPSKKRKRKDKPSSTTAGLVIADDDGEWGASNRKNASDEDDDSDGPTTVSTGGTFRKSKKSNWTVIGGPAPSNADQAAADRILTDAAREQTERMAEANMEDAPMVVDGGGDDTARMESGAVAGLQTAAQVAAQVERKKKEDRRRAEEAEVEGSGKGQETIYRDASGRIINVAMKRAEARKKQAEEERKKEEELEALKGDVQRREKEQRAEALKEARFMNVARYADDVEMNEEMKEKDRWNDPAAKFLTKKKEGKSASGKPLFKGSAPPNRYGIRPGYRWDGVDRSNGFEKEYFASRNRRQNKADLEYQWQMDE